MFHSLTTTLAEYKREIVVYNNRKKENKFRLCWERYPFSVFLREFCYSVWSLNDRSHFEASAGLSSKSITLSLYLSFFSWTWEHIRLLKTNINGYIGEAVSKRGTIYPFKIYYTFTLLVFKNQHSSSIPKTNYFDIKSTVNFLL